MTATTNTEVLLRAIDPLSDDLERENRRHRDDVWSRVVAGATHDRRRRPRGVLIGATSLATVATAIVIVVGSLPGATPTSAAATTLHHAAVADASAAALPPLAEGQYYYQSDQVAMDCAFASESSPLIRYVSAGTVQSWTSLTGPGQIVITPTPVGQDGSHFASPVDETAWVTAGKPFVPCALASPSNSLIGNPANANTQSSRGGYAATAVGYAGFGIILGIARVATPIDENGIPKLVLTGSQNAELTAGANVANLPSDVAQIAAMLANGEINLDGSLSSSPQICPANALPGAGTGCNTNQQLALIKDLLQLPDASAKFGSVLYQVLAQMPGATVAADATDSFGNSGTEVTVPVIVGTTTTGEFQVLIDPTTGTLLSSTDLQRAGFGIGTGTTAFSPDASISYGAISIVQSVGAVPPGTN